MGFLTQLLTTEKGLGDIAAEADLDDGAAVVSGAGGVGIAATEVAAGTNLTELMVHSLLAEMERRLSRSSVWS